LNAVTSVKDQGSCGSGYAFASAGALEGLQYIKSKSLVEFSEQ
jgi:C1A family cysteine protease